MEPFRCIARALCTGAWILLGVAPVHAHAQQATVDGIVRAGDTGHPVAAALVRVERGSARRLTDAAGRFRLVAAPGRWIVSVEVVGYAPSRDTIQVAAGGSARLDIALRRLPVILGEVVVTATRESQARSEVAASVGVIEGSDLRATRPAHPSEVMSRLAGVWVNVTGGEGHMAAIRQPLSTNPVYLYLEDGVPSRSTGFFNHNALYEINLPQAERVEVLKGPPSALYGSDAIGGVVNVSTRPAPLRPEAALGVEGGAYGWARALLTAGMPLGLGGVRADLNLTRTDGWRDGTAYDRQSATLRWDRPIGARSNLKVVAAWSRIDQQTAGSSSVNEADYRANPTTNYTPISYRRVSALRLSAAFERWSERTHLTLTPFVRHNAMDMLPNWTLSFDPQVSETGNRSVGLLATLRHDLPAWRTRLIAGVDADVSPGGRLEQRITTTANGPVFTAYQAVDTLYEYDVTFRGLSPYLQAESAPSRRLRLSAGLRLDWIGYRYASALAPLATGAHRRPADTTVTFRHLSPKLGATVLLGGTWSAYGSWRHSFRVPSESQLFRQGRAANTVGLTPVRANSAELGVRGALGALSVEAAAYSMVVRDDILGFAHPDGTRETLNAGRTWHRGLELTAGVTLPAALRVDAAGSLARHTYERWQPSPTVDLSRHEMENAPRLLLNSRVTWTPAALGGGALSLEWQRIGRYWLDQANTQRYAGHHLLHARLTTQVAHGLELRARVQNLANARYAETAAFTPARGREFAPGLPRTLQLGAQYTWAR